jgi:hypothetical protein
MILARSSQAGLCKTQHMTLAMGFNFWGMWNPSTGYALMLANDLRWGKHGRVPIFAPSVLKPPPFALLLAVTGQLRYVSKEDSHPDF